MMFLQVSSLAFFQNSLELRFTLFNVFSSLSKYVIGNVWVICTVKTLLNQVEIEILFKESFESQVTYLLCEC